MKSEHMQMLMLDTVKRWVPITYEAFWIIEWEAPKYPQMVNKIIKKLISGEKIDPEKSGLSKREWNELMTCF